MINEKDLRTLLLVLILSFIIPLVIVNETATFLGYYNRLVQYFSYCLATISFIATLKKSWLPKITGNYVGGTYEGISQRIIDQTNGHTENIKIKITQSLVSVKLTGCSYDADGNQNATFKGYLIEGENKNYRFYVKIVTTHNERSGLIDLDFNNNPVTGFGTSIDLNGSTRWRFNLNLA
jgi:hypothetical protein